mmetsp:Transcript_83283/g.254620  ORF Transcript_83283/g.254620 Transcript_83283/m.254620 type:complete len:237 (-) Transcript_83283:20-730(-)
MGQGDDQQGPPQRRHGPWHAGAWHLRARSGAHAGPRPFRHRQAPRPDARHIPRAGTGVRPQGVGGSPQISQVRQGEPFRQGQRELVQVARLHGPRAVRGFRLHQRAALVQVLRCVAPRLRQSEVPRLRPRRHRQVLAGARSRAALPEFWQSQRVRPCRAAASGPRGQARSRARRVRRARQAMPSQPEPELLLVREAAAEVARRLEADEGPEQFHVGLPLSGRPGPLGSPGLRAIAR